MFAPNYVQVVCDATQDPSTYDGYQIELSRQLAKALGWADEDWFFTCIDEWTPLIDDILAPDGRCTMLAAGGCREQWQLVWG